MGMNTVIQNPYQFTFMNKQSIKMIMVFLIEKSFK